METGKTQSPLEGFTAKVEQVTDFNVFYALLVQEGVSVLDSQSSSLLPEARADYIISNIAFMTYAVLENRRKKGLSNQMYDLMGKDLKKLEVEKIIPDENLRRIMGEGIIQGLQTRRTPPLADRL